jgi:hypothetical protein
MSTRWLPILWLALAALLGGGRLGTGAELPCLRTHDPLIAELIATGRDRSPTFRSLLARLEQSNLIVHLKRAAGPWTKTPRGFTRFVGSTGGYRYVQVTIANAATPSVELVALVGHELQHRVELVEAPAVVDPVTYHELYRAIGYPSCRSRRCYDTNEAVIVGQRVLAELNAAPFVDGHARTSGY